MIFKTEDSSEGFYAWKNKSAESFNAVELSLDSLLFSGENSD